MEKVLWSPTPKRVEQSQMNLFQKKFYPNVKNYNELHEESVGSPHVFWKNLIEFFPIVSTGEKTPVLKDTTFDEYTWFSNVKLNFAENLLNNGYDEDIAFLSLHESGRKKEMSYKVLRQEVKSLGLHLKKYIKQGDVLGAYMPNIPETVMSMLATSAIGGTFTSTSCDFGVNGVVDRFGESKPKIMVAAIGYEYNGKYFDQTEKIKEIEKQLPWLEQIIIVDFLNKGADLSQFKNAVLFSDLVKDQDVDSFEFVKVPFAAPLYIMYSSGTTGKPKCIVHSVGGALLQHIKELGLHSDLTREKSIFFFTTCGWMMWNWLMTSLYFGSKVVLYEGAPSFPSFEGFLSKINDEKINIFGTSPKFLRALEDSGFKKKFDFSSLETILSTGSPLLPEQFDFVYRELKQDVLLASISGGTDIIGCFMLGNPTLPVVRGEIQCLGLGMNVKALLDAKTEAKRGEQGELTCVSTFPSRPIYFLNDSDGKKFKEAYFDQYPGLWYHGDFVTITENGGVIVHGRSDATLNPGGIRIGTAEIYRQTEGVEYLVDSLCVGRPTDDGDVDVVLFVKMKGDEVLNDDRIKELKTKIRANTTPRHVPKDIFAVKDIPYTRSGKKMELLIARILQGKRPTNLEAVANPECLSDYDQFIK